MYRYFPFEPILPYELSYKITIFCCVLFSVYQWIEFPPPPPQLLTMLFWLHSRIVFNYLYVFIHGTPFRFSINSTWVWARVLEFLRFENNLQKLLLRLTRIIYRYPFPTSGACDLFLFRSSYLRIISTVRAEQLTRKVPVNQLRLTICWSFLK